MEKHLRQVTRLSWLLMVMILTTLPAFTPATRAEPRMPRILTVDTGGDPSPIPGACTADPNDCSLRGAIDAANADPGSTINFASNVLTVILTQGALPSITGAGTIIKPNTGQSVRINANNQDSGFRIAGDQIRIEGLHIYGGKFHNILVTLTANQQVFINNNVIGNNATETPPGCTADEITSDHGVYVTRQQVGYTPGPHNVWIYNNSIECNQGTDTTADGSGVTIDGVDGVRVGMVNAATAGPNTIRANRNAVRIINGATDNQVRSNTITANQFGVQMINSVSTTQVANNSISGAVYGVEIATNSSQNIIQTNIISNNGNGVEVSGTSNDNDINGNTITNNANGIRLVDGPTSNDIRNNIISSNTLDGIFLSGAATQSNEIFSNKIGTNSAGTAADGNGGDGIEIFGGRLNQIGGTPARRNIISGNGDQGIDLSDSAAANLIQSNYIGTNMAGTAAVPNVGSGIHIHDSADNNLVGGSLFSHLNLIGGNGTNGILIQDNGTTGNIIMLNDIGVNSSSTNPPLLPLPNGTRGVAILNGAQDNIIGSVASIAPRPAAKSPEASNAPQDIRDIDDEANLIWNNTGPGIEINNADNNHVRSNSIRLNSVGVLLSGGTQDAIITRTLLVDNNSFAIREDSGTRNNRWFELSVYNNNNRGLQIEKLDSSAPVLPTITSIGRQTRTFRGTGTNGATLELYAQDIFSWTFNQSPPAPGEGVRFLGRTTVNNGAWSVTVPALALRGLDNNCFTAIQTTNNGSSEFSQAYCGVSYLTRVMKGSQR